MGALLSILGLGFMGALLSTTTTTSRGQSRGTHGSHIIHFPDQPALLPVKKDETGQEQASLSTLVEKWCPSLFKEFKSLWWLSKYVAASLPDTCGLTRETVVTFRHYTVYWETSPRKIQ